MTSARKVLSNQRNAERSTGPQTVTGKARSALNAATHGLSSKFILDAETKSRRKQLAAIFAGHHAGNSQIMAQAEEAAEAHIMYMRVKEARRRAWVSASLSPEIMKRGSLSEMNEFIDDEDFFGLSGISLSELKIDMPYAFEEAFENDIDRQAAILEQASKLLAKLIRYERRAVNRRDRAFVALEKLRGEAD